MSYEPLCQPRGNETGKGGAGTRRRGGGGRRIMRIVE